MSAIPFLVWMKPEWRGVYRIIKRPAGSGSACATLVRLDHLFACKEI